MSGLNCFRDHRKDVLGYGGGRRQAGRFHADEVNRLRDLGVARDHKIGDAMACRRNQLGPQSGIAELQIFFSDFGQQRFGALGEIANRQAAALVVIFAFDVSCGRPEQKRIPQSSREMHAETQSVVMRQADTPAC